MRGEPQQVYTWRIIHDRKCNAAGNSILHEQQPAGHITEFKRECPFTFNPHQFRCRIGINAAGNGVSFFQPGLPLPNAQLTGVYNTNTLTTSYTAGATANAGTTAYNWGAASNAVGYDITVNSSTPASSNVTLTRDATTLVAADAFLMVPQTIAASQQKITLTWTVTTGTGVTQTVTTNTKVIDLNDIKNGESHIDWAKNAQVTYTITIGPKPIYFTATVDGWAAETNGTISVY